MARTRTILLGIQASIYCIDVDVTTDSLAIGAGPEVHIARKIAADFYATYAILPKPPSAAMATELRVRPRGTHFIKNGCQLIVTYLNHGIM